ncbi:MAG: transketolase C-terminal domain-containing protein, partial [Planctomycetota bacterium]
FTIAAPRDATDMRRMLELALTVNGPLALRYPRDNTPGSERIHANERTAMVPGKAEVLVEAPAGERVVCLWAFGALVNQALESAERLARRGIAVTVVDARFAKPLDEELLAQHALAYRHILTVEEHQRAGGFGSAVLESLSRLSSARAQVRLCGIPDRYIEHMTTREEQLAACGLDAEGLERAVLNLVTPTKVS